MIFRIHSNGPIDLKAWGSRGNKLTDEALKTIDDDLIRGNASKVATSIPNPFARMYLFETAFQMIKDIEHSGNSLYHQLVSDCLDVFQLIFMMGADNKNIHFKKWHSEQSSAELKSKGMVQVSGKNQPHGHTLLGESFDLFFKSNRFKGFEEIYFIYYKDILLGGTSPLTVFFTTPNFQREMIKYGHSFPPSKGSDILFDDEPAALHERDEDFQIYMHKFRRAFKGELSEQCPQLNQYLINSGNNYRPALVSNIEDGYSLQHLLSEYESVNYDYNTAETVNSGLFSVLKYPSPNESKHIESNSGFVMQTTVNNFKNYVAEDGTHIELKTPLALVSNCNARITYIWDTWNRDTVVEYMANIELHDRILPGTDNSKYPYVTTEDFLEDRLVEMPYSINNDHFFSGFSGKFEYLLPIKKEYFNFFTLADLEKYLSINHDPEKVSVILKIPIRDGNFIEFKKVYDKKSDVYKLPTPTNGFGLGIFPFYKVIDQPKLNEYVVLLVDNAEEEVDLNFYKYENVINDEPLDYEKKVRLPKSSTQAGSTYYKLKKNTDNAFDIIEVVNGLHQGLIIPRFKEININTHTQKFNFAIDFGTSNTHIAYNSTNDPSIKAFDVSENDIQMVLLNSRSKESLMSDDISQSYDTGFKSFFDMVAIKNREFVPSVKGNKASIKYPIRTSTCESKNFIAEPPSLFGNINIGYFLDAEEKVLDHTRYTTNIKWGMETNPGGIPEQNRIAMFFEQVLWMIKNKIILNNGTLDGNIAWFVPVSMKMNIRNIFESIWKDALTNVFGEDHNIKLIRDTESTVPYFYLKNLHGFYEANDALNVDIGGGTIDIIFNVKSKNKAYSTSFKFGANDIWGDGITHSAGEASQKDNGFFLMMKEKIDRGDIKLDGKIRNYYSTFYKNAIFNSADMVSFLFKYDKLFRFTNSIKAHAYLPSLLFLHYGAVIYHISQIINEKDIDIPMYITFTGKGSEYIKIIFPPDPHISENVQTEIDKFTIKLLTMFTGKDVPGIFKVYLQENPKEVTANGGISMLNKDATRIDPAEMVHRGFVPEDAPESLKNGSNLKVQHLESIQDAVLKNIYRFVDMLSADEELNAFFNKHDVTFQFGEENLRQKVEKYAIHSYNQIKTNLKKNSMDGEIIEESPFFWGLKDVFYRLSKELYKLDSQ